MGESRPKREGEDKVTLRITLLYNKDLHHPKKTAKI